MCGLIGIINKKWEDTLSTQSESVLKQLMYVGALRGFDATGVWKVTKDHKTEIVKKAIPAGYFMGLKPVKELIDFYFKDSFAVFAHNRKATQGNKDDETSHPFKENHITLMHNGTLNSWERQKYLSDSHYITGLLSKENKEHKPIESLMGAYALVWHNAEKKQINFCRNEDRPLWIIETKDWYVIVSEYEMGEWILLRNGFDVLSTTEVEKNYIYKLSWKNNRLNLNKAKFTPYKYTPKKTSYNCGSLYEEDECEFGGFGATPFTKPKEEPHVPKILTSFTSPTTLTDSTLTVFPTSKVKVKTTPGGYQPWSGFGLSEDRYEITGHILFPLSRLNQAFKFSVKVDDWDDSMLNKQCTGDYNYTSQNNVVTLKTLQHMPAEIGDKLAENDDKNSAWLITKNKFEINEDNWDEVTACKCEHCQEDFALETAEQAIVIPLFQHIGGTKTQYGMRYICAECVQSKKVISLTKARENSISPLN